MRIPRVWPVLGLGLLLMGGLLAADDGKKVRGVLPQGYGRLGLSDDQKQSIYKVQADHDAKIDDLESQLKKLKSERKIAMEKVLTAAQRARLREIVAEKAPAEEGEKPKKK